MTESSTIRLIARPSRHTERPAATPAEASVFSLATFEAKVVAAKVPVAAAAKLRISASMLASDLPGKGENTFVESQVRTCTP